MRYTIWQNVIQPTLIPTQPMRSQLGFFFLPYTAGPGGYYDGVSVVDVLDGKVSMENFVAQISEEDLIAMFRGEGMCSPKVTAGTAAAFGGITESLQALGVPVGCCSDGPSGIRMDCGTKAFSLPNGTLLGCTFNTELVGDLYEMTGKELRLNKIDSLLGPGMNIHRNPLNGRNFEYISEDPILTGRICAAKSSMTVGMMPTPTMYARSPKVNAYTSKRKRFFIRMIRYTGTAIITASAITIKMIDRTGTRME